MNNENITQAEELRRADFKQRVFDAIETEDFRRAFEMIEEEERRRADLKRQIAVVTEIISSVVSIVGAVIRSLDNRISDARLELGGQSNKVRQIMEHIPIPEDEPKIIVRVSRRIPIQDEDADFSR